MTNCATRNRRSLLLRPAGLAAVCVPIAFGLLHIDQAGGRSDRAHRQIRFSAEIDSGHFAIRSIQRGRYDGTPAK